MAINQLTFGGDLLPCTVERYPDFKKPSRKVTRYVVPGRNGDIVLFEDAFNNIEQAYEVYTGGGANEAPIFFGALAAVLYKVGYQKLSDTYDPTHFRLAMFYGGADVENSFNKHGKTTLIFDCRPERFLNSGDSYINVTSGQVLTNPTSFTAMPLIAIDINPNVSSYVSINGVTLNIDSPYRTTHGSVYFDSETMNAYTGTLNRNQYVSGTYPTLGAGDNTIEFGAGINTVRIRPRWWEL